MNFKPVELSALLGSRICHDIISPLGAIGNGLELLAMSGHGGSPELSLISDSVASANARVRFFRVAYGVANPDQMTGSAEVRSILNDLYSVGRFNADWVPSEDQPRGAVRKAFLAIQCIESALPQGGRITVSTSNATWRITGVAAKLRIRPEVWDYLAGTADAPALASSDVQFALLRGLCDPESPRIRHSDNDIEISF